MLEYRSLNEIIDHPGLRIVLVKGMPSPWGQAAKTIFDLKGLDYAAAPWMLGEANDDIVAWGGEASAPIVAWASGKADSSLDRYSLSGRAARAEAFANSRRRDPACVNDRPLA